MTRMLHLSALVSLLLNGAIFGFFYAWVCSTMWGLDAADPALAIGAMQAMNASVRNMTFAPAFFGTPLVLLGTAALALGQRRKEAALSFASAGLLYLCGGIGLTMAVNVPMNEALAAISVPTELSEAKRIWQAYSQPWQFWNIMRTIASGCALALTGAGLLLLNRQSA